MLNNNLLNHFILIVFLFILLITSGQASTAQYTYDNLNRLVQVQYDDGTIIQYTYDTAGNRLAKEVTASAQGSASPAGPPSTALAYAPVKPNSPPLPGETPEMDR
jgi:YD repeat-containing protein